MSGGNSSFRGRWGPGTAAQSWGCPIPEGAQGHGWALCSLSWWEQPAHCRSSRTRWSLRSVPTQPVLIFKATLNPSEMKNPSDLADARNSGFCGGCLLLFPRVQRDGEQASGGWGVLFVEPFLSWTQSLLGSSQERIRISKYDRMENNVCVARF